MFPSINIKCTPIIWILKQRLKDLKIVIKLINNENDSRYNQNLQKN